MAKTRGRMSILFVFLLPQVLSADLGKERGPQPTLVERFVSERTRSVVGRPVELVDVTPSTAEQLFAQADAAFYVESQGLVRLLVPTEGASSLGRAVPLERSEVSLESFLSAIETDFPGVVGGDGTRFLLKVPAVAEASPGPAASEAGRTGARPLAVAGVVFTESFESGLGNWNASDNSSGAYTWGRTSCAARTGAYSADAVRGGYSGQSLACSSSYPDGVITQIVHKSCENVYGATQAWLDAYVTLATEDGGFDRVAFFYPDPGQPGSLAGYAYWGTTSSWWHVVMNMKQFFKAGDLTRNTCNQLSIYYYTDSSVSGGFGARVDDVTIRTDTPSFLRCSISASTTSGSTPLTVTFSASVFGASTTPSYAWNFGDGVGGSGQTVTHTFTSQGRFEPLVVVQAGDAACLANVVVLAGVAAPPTTRIPQVDTSSCPQVKVITSVTDSAGAPIQGLGSGNFSVREDGVLKSIQVTPVTQSGSTLWIAVNIDNSGSLSTTDFSAEKAATRSFIDLLGASDQIALYGFSTSYTLIRDFTSDKNAAKASLDAYAYSGGSTALYDSLYASLTNTGARAGRRAVIAMTDGEDTSSSRTQSQVIDLARSLSIPIYTIGFGAANGTILQTIASQTGGAYYASASIGNLQQILVSIGNNINSQYQITYTSTASGTGTHTVEVTTTTSAGSSTASKQYQCQSIFPCQPNTTTMCLHGTRFKVQVNWRDFNSNVGPGQVVGTPATSSGLFWFFQSDNWEFMVKVLNGCGVNGRWWVMGAAATTVEYTLTVTDTNTGSAKSYFNALGTSAPAIADITAFSSCP